MARRSTGASGSLLESESSMVQELQQQIIIFSHQIVWLTPTLSQPTVPPHFFTRPSLSVAATSTDFSPQCKHKPRTTSEFLMTRADKVEIAKGNKSHSSELFIVGFGRGAVGRRVEKADYSSLFFSSAKLEND